MNNQTKAAITRLSLHYLALACTILFCWVIYPYKWMKLLFLKIRIYQAKCEADFQCRQLNKAVYVLQDNDEIIVSTRDKVRPIHTSMNKKLAKQGKSFLDWDYRHAIIYTAYPNQCKN